jgi:hypothetical protein
MTRRKLLWAAPVAALAGLGLAAARWLDAAPAGQGDPKPATTLPVSQVVLFNSGVGYFARSGEVEGDARVDLTFRESDINDLLKSMTLQDLDGGRVAAVSYDSREPASRALASFAVNLDNNPSLTQILTQARGEKVEVATQPSAQGQPGTLAGVIVGVEKVHLPAGPNQQVEADVLDLLTADGLRAVKLMDVLRIKFTNPVLEAELKRALDVVALSHDAQKKAVSLHFSGDGRRRVKVGYVVEAPIWKASYRLVLDRDGKPYLQGWAAVENTTDEDWSQVRMALVSGRPISFKMDLYDPLYVPRPVVEPELFASLRPPAYQGAHFNQEELALPDQNAAERQKANLGPVAGTPPGGGMGGFGGAAGADRKPAAGIQAQRLEDLGGVVVRDRSESKTEQLRKELAGRMDLGAVQSAATAAKLGDSFQYHVDHPVSLARQKSALLPIVGKDVEATRVSVYNPAVQPKHPLLGLKFKNTTGAHLAQGPITVYEGSTYAGDARILDVQPNEERLLAYAIDLGMEVKMEDGKGSTAITSVKATKGVVHTVRKVREEKVYKAVSRADADRTLLVQHPNRTNQGFRLAGGPKPDEETADLWRFRLAVPAGKTAELTVAEERDAGEDVALTNAADEQLLYFVRLKEAGPALKEKLKQALALKGKWDGARRELGQVQADLARITADQDRIRKNLRETPKEAPVYDTYLKKLSDQEKEVDALTEKQKALTAQEHDAKKSYEDFLANLSD